MAATRDPLPEALALPRKLSKSEGGLRYSTSSAVFEHDDRRVVPAGFQPFAVYEVAMASVAPHVERRDGPETGRGDPRVGAVRARSRGGGRAAGHRDRPGAQRARARRPRCSSPSANDGYGQREPGPREPGSALTIPRGAQQPRPTLQKGSQMHNDELSVPEQRSRSRMTKRLPHALLLAGVSGTLLLAAVSAAEAGSSRPSVDPSRSPSHQTTAPLQGRGVRASARPRGCYGRTDNPHRSRHRPGYITVQGRTVCSGRAVTVRVELYRVVFGQRYFLDRGSDSGIGRATANASARRRCGTFLGRSYHGASGHYPTVTQNQNTIPCRRR